MTDAVTVSGVPEAVKPVMLKSVAVPTVAFEPKLKVVVVSASDWLMEPLVE